MTVSRPARAALHLEVRAMPCPQALLRILNLLAVQDCQPISVRADRNARGQHMLIALEPLEDRAAELLLRKVQAIVTVSRARYVRRRSATV